ncbi:hypothetical protein [Legionella sp. CNM-4043-24]|uniref:hypothetical protein n=1 Tax=Legionella sp. CNM-4043-24 TaxID=3421646 RepID=UPI00403AA4D3
MMLFKRLQMRALVKKLKSMKQTRQHNQPSDEILAKEVSLYMALASIYHSLRKNKKYPYADIAVKECWRAAASIDSAEANYNLGKSLLEEARFREGLENEALLASASNEKQAAMLYAEALAYLTRAETLGHVLARRLHGLCYINGWGLDVDKDKGFDLVVASIGQENSWDKVPQIFASIGLNKPEFFSALVKHREKGV